MLPRIVTAIFIFSLFIPSPCFAQGNSEKILYQKNSLYQQITVIEDTAKRERSLYCNKRDTVQGAMNLDDPDKLVLGYSRTAFVSLAFLDREPREVLVAGLGVGSIPKYLHRYYPSAYIATAEIDPDVLTVAEKFFFFERKKNMRVHISDARVFIKRTSQKFDMIFLDAYHSDYIPFHLTTVEFLREVKRRLKPDGVVVSNIFSPFFNKFFHSMIKTYRSTFPQVSIFNADRSSNYIFISTTGDSREDESSISEKARKIQSSKNFDIDVHRLSSAFASVANSDSTSHVLTDDFAPVELYQHMNTEGRK